jgi:hypothetical protein
MSAVGFGYYYKLRGLGEKDHGGMSSLPPLNYDHGRSARCRH